MTTAHRPAAAANLHPQGVPGIGRITGFSDGVFSIAITLLVLDLKVPDVLPAGGLASLLPELLPRFGGHILSFLVLGVYWVGHHNVCMHIRLHNRILLWLNLLFMMFVAAMPFFANLIMHHGADPTALAAYALDLILAGVALDGIWWYASAGRRLVNSCMEAELVRRYHLRILTAPAIYLVAIPVAFLNRDLARMLFWIVPLVYIFPVTLDRYHHRVLAGADATEKSAGEPTNFPVS